MLPPIRPSPTIPICIVTLRSGQRPPDRSLERGKAGLDIAPEMHAERAPTAFGEHLEVGARLRGLHDPEACAVSRDRQVLGVVRGDLEKDAVVGPAFVGLAGRMQETGTEAETGCDPPPVAQSEPQLLQCVDMSLVARKIGQDRRIIPAPDAPEMRLEPALGAPVGAGLAQ